MRSYEDNLFNPGRCFMTNLIPLVVAASLACLFRPPTSTSITSFFPLSQVVIYAADNGGRFPFAIARVVDCVAATSDELGVHVRHESDVPASTRKIDARANATGDSRRRQVFG